MTRLFLRKPNITFLLIFLLILLGFRPFKLWAKSPKYRVEFRGVGSTRQLRSLKNASSLIRYKKNAPKSLSALRYRADKDVPEFIQVLHAYSYYDACVTTRAFREDSGRYKMVIAVNKGDPYKLSQFNFQLVEEGGSELYEIEKVKLRELGIRLGKPAVSTQIVDAEKQLITLLNQNGHPFAKIKDQSILVDQAQKTVAVNLHIDEGPIAYFGSVTIKGGESVRKRFVTNRIAWKEGELFSTKKILETEKNLYDSGIFAIVSISHGKDLNSSQALPMKIDLLGGKHNNFTIGGSYTTTWEGLGGSASWQNLNIFKLGLNLQLNYAINQKRQEAGLEFLFPDFFSAKNKLVVKSEALIRNVMPNYQEKGVDTNLFVERMFSRYYKMSLGSRFDQFSTTDSLRNGYYSIFGIPFFANLQSSDKVLINPTQGGWFSLNFTPYFGLNRTTDHFAEIKLEGSVYQYLIPSRRIILALNAVVGSLFGSSLDNMPPSYRFYAGSPQHLRGYPYQKISPLNAHGRETGGRSLFLGSIEPRVMILKSFAIVGFLDVGNVYLNTWPDFDEAFVKSVGVGARYYSIVGPLRLDIGFPLDKRPNVNRNYQIYFSIGQAF